MAGKPFHGSVRTHRKRDQRKRAKARKQQELAQQLSQSYLLTTSTAASVPDITSFTDFPDVVDHRHTSSNSNRINSSSTTTMKSTGSNIPGSFQNSSPPPPVTISVSDTVENQEQQLVRLKDLQTESTMVPTRQLSSAIDSSTDESSPPLIIAYSPEDTKDTATAVTVDDRPMHYQQDGVPIGEISSDEEGHAGSSAAARRVSSQEPQQQHKSQRSRVTVVVINSVEAIATIKIYKEKEGSEATTGRSNVRCTTMIISVGTDDDYFFSENGNRNKSITVDDGLLKDLVDSGTDIGVNEIFKLCKWE